MISADGGTWISASNCPAIATDVPEQWLMQFLNDLEGQIDRAYGVPRSMLARPQGQGPWWLGRALVAFALWPGLMCLALALEYSAPGRWVFSSVARGIVYLVVQVALLLAASVMTLVRGPNRDRAIVLLPTILLVLYGLMLVCGEG